MHQMKQMTIVNVTRRSKYIYIHLEKDDMTYLLVSHLGMTGAWFVVNSIDEVTEINSEDISMCVDDGRRRVTRLFGYSPIWRTSIY